MLDVATLRRDRAATPAGAPVVEAVRRIAARDLAPLVREIDAGLYPEQVLRSFGKAAAFGTHLPGGKGEADLSTAIAAMAVAGEHCLATAFCMWCQDALAWYVFTSDNAALKQTIGPAVARGEVLGGTGLSNPMKTFFGIESMRLKARRVGGGFTVRGTLPWVSNLGPDHYFGAVFELEDAPRHFVMAVVPCASEGLRLVGDHKFVALDGTRTFGVQFREVFIPDANVLADPIESYLKRIRAGFVLLQAGMAIGLIRGCIDLMRQVKSSLGHVNKYLDMQPEDFERKLEALEAAVELLAATPFEPGPGYWRHVIETRLAAGETSIAAAHWAMLHCGARGYVATGAAQRRLREAYFVAIVTPATKQLRKMLADMPA
jgi:alkylation response protein AidB-like acyl-CoA dehydrogenase